MSSFFFWFSCLLNCQSALHSTTIVIIALDEASMKRVIFFDTFKLHVKKLLILFLKFTPLRNCSSQWLRIPEVKRWNKKQMKSNLSHIPVCFNECMRWYLLGLGNFSLPPSVSRVFLSIFLILSFI